jgi:hypothetical protein
MNNQQGKQWDVKKTVTLESDMIVTFVMKVKDSIRLSYPDVKLNPQSNTSLSLVLEY